jgi:hypothetical protein
VRRRKSELLEEDAVHLEGVVLPSVEDAEVDAARDAGADHRRHLDDLGPGADLDRDLHEVRAVARSA